MPTWLWLTLLAWLAAINLATVAAFAIDKRRARLGRWRTRERTLHWFELLGGWPGALLAMRWFRHKTRDARYRVTQGLIVAVHVALAAATAWRAMNR